MSDVDGDVHGIGELRSKEDFAKIETAYEGRRNILVESGGTVE